MLRIDPAVKQHVKEQRREERNQRADAERMQARHHPCYIKQNAHRDKVSEEIASRAGKKPPTKPGRIGYTTAFSTATQYISQIN